MALAFTCILRAPCNGLGRHGAHARARMDGSMVGRKEKEKNIEKLRKTEKTRAIQG